MSYIVPRDKPHYCIDCIFLDRNYRDCKLQKIDYCDFNKQYKNCPLIELPPHGRLGDLDALYEEISNGNKAYNGLEGYDGEYQHIGNVDDCMDVIKMANTVVEAEGSEI